MSLPGRQLQLPLLSTVTVPTTVGVPLTVSVMLITSFGVPVPLSTGRGSLVVPPLGTGPVIWVTLSVTIGAAGVAGASVSMVIVTGCDGALSLPVPSTLVTVRVMS